MNAVFADTSFFLAAMRSDDDAHAQALAESSVNRRIVTTEFILLELGNACSKAVDHADFIALVAGVRNTSRFTIIPLDSRLMELGMELMASRSDKDWSLTDCISFIVMQGAGLLEALTSDHDFEQAGFIALLK